MVIGTHKYHHLLLALAGVIIVSGIFAEWISFPISSPVDGLSWDNNAYESMLKSFPAAPFAITFVVAFFLLAYSYKRIGTWILAFSLSMLLIVPIYALFFDTTWLLRYTNDASQYSGIINFIRNIIGIPNSASGFSLADADSFQYLPDRIVISVKLLGWGWSLTNVGCIMMVLIFHVKGWLSSWQALLQAWVLFCLLLVTAGMPSYVGEFYYRQADQRMALGEYHSAIASYTKALQYDSTLGVSDIFLLKLSKAYYQKEGTLHPYAQIYLASVEASSNLSASKTRLNTLAANQPASSIDAYIATMAKRKELELWIRQSVIHHVRGNTATAAHGFQYVLDHGYDGQDVRFYQARMLSELHEFDASIQLYQNLIQATYNPSLKAALYNALGDAYTAAGDHHNARQAYSTAYSLDKKGNLWAIKGLSGT